MRQTGNAVPGQSRATRSRATTLDMIRAAGMISRVQLAEVTGLTEATISTIVRRLINEGLVSEVGREESTGGKPRVLLALNPTARFAIGIHLGHTETTCVIADLSGAIVARWRRPGVCHDRPGTAVTQIGSDVDAMMQHLGLDRERLLGVGVVFPGPIATRGGIIRGQPSLCAWADFPLAETLAEVLGRPVQLDNDATASAIGEYWTGSTGAAAVFATLFMGTGIGSGVVAHGSVYRGASSNAGEVGHICVDPAGPPCWCGARGCLEAVAGPRAVVEEAMEWFETHPQDALPLSGDGERTVLDFAALARAANREHAYASALLRRSAATLAVGARTLANLFDLDCIVLSGPCLIAAGSLYAPVIQDELRSFFFARGSHPVQVRISTNTLDAAAVGAAALVLRAELTPREPELLPPATA